MRSVRLSGRRCSSVLHPGTRGVHQQRPLRSRRAQPAGTPAACRSDFWSDLRRPTKCACLIDDRRSNILFKLFHVSGEVTSERLQRKFIFRDARYTHARNVERNFQQLCKVRGRIVRDTRRLNSRPCYGEPARFSVSNSRGA